ncbi:MAG: hypothetical protein ACR2K1_08835 [Saprospiraceae bacterium]
MNYLVDYAPNGAAADANSATIVAVSQRGFVRKQFNLPADEAEFYHALRDLYYLALYRQGADSRDMQRPETRAYLEKLETWVASWSLVP